MTKAFTPAERPAASPAAGEAQRAKPVRIQSIIGGLAGNLIEWYDFLAYSIFSIYFAGAFFPSDNPTVQLMNTAAIAAVGYIARPLGSWMVGLYADRRGRKSALTGSVLTMCIGSLIIAVTPGYGTIGIFAPILLIVARLLQGLSMGGEYGTSATYLSEVAPAHRRGFYLGFLQVSVVAGQLLALGLMLLMQHVLLTSAQLHSWGWRVPFVLGGLLALFALYMRRNVTETAAFESSVKERGPGVAQQMLDHWRQIVLAIGITVGGTVAFYTYTIYMQKFLVNSVGLDKEASTLVSAAALLLYMPLQPLFGFISDLVGRRPVLIFFGLCCTFFSVPLFNAMSHTKDPLVAFALSLAGLVMLSGFTSVHMLAKTELFPARIRALAVGLPYALTTAILGGTTEFVALNFKASGHEPWFYWYVTAWAAASLIVYIRMPETRHRTLSGAAA
ncbi:Alpha-ketoglutarate permease [Caballeronia glathei]|jgi:MHS family alpha-ketoglutarate permease-like MFS transporter|uniref:Alpha-ketoglutarate transporter n=1 Tax=Caballeronia glathei TaxID=60547 RepID=A0A069PQU2_9BURK|nr:MFS transporter [Caballeronia glathei]KDR42224.1 alpha-ketoglutarate transporter [Caballeronia glathei]CDY77221.1 Alpha-ketoglutarate permease [Caballeronia glathei]